MASKPLTGWRRIATGTWRDPDDPQIYGLLEVDASRLVAFQKACREATGLHVTPTHLVGRALARAIHAVPDLNVRIVGGRAIQRPSIDVFFITAIAGGHDLSGTKVERTDEKSVLEVARDLDPRTRVLKAGKDPGFVRTKKTMDWLPMPLLRLALRITAFFVGKHARTVRALALAASPFGSAMISNIGSLGLPIGFAPIAWLYHVPILLLVGAIEDKPVAVDGHVEVRPVLPITATIDHRYADGWHISQLMRVFREYLDAPDLFEELPAAEARTTPEPVATAPAA